MQTFTLDELAFLNRHRIEPEDVHDGRYQSKSAWQREAKENGKILVLGSPCRARGHRLRTRAGHCVQCDPKKIAYEARYSSPGYVYIGGSLSRRLVKIGTAVDLDQRERNLRFQLYGGLADWVILFHVRANEAGKIEQNAREP